VDGSKGVNSSNREQPFRVENPFGVEERDRKFRSSYNVVPFLHETVKVESLKACLRWR
jgi:hypothetical protein